MSDDEKCYGCKYRGFTNEFCNNCEDYDSYVSDGKAELAALRAKFDEAKGVFALTAAALNEEIFCRKGLEAEVARLKGEACKGKNCEVVSDALSASCEVLLKHLRHAGLSPDEEGHPAEQLVGMMLARLMGVLKKIADKCDSHGKECWRCSGCENGDEHIPEECDQFVALAALAPDPPAAPAEVREVGKGGGDGA